MAEPLDHDGMRTMFIGLFIGMGFYALGLIARTMLPEAYAYTAWFALSFIGLVVLLGWFLAVRRGFRIRRLGRIGKGKRAVGRKLRDGARRPPLR